MRQFNTLFLSTVIVLTLTIGCKNKNTEATQEKPVEIVTPVATAGPAIPGIPGELMSSLLNKCNSMDYIFNNMNYSMSITEKDAILQNLGFIDINAPIGQIPDGCKPIGRKFIKLDGGEEYGVDVYLTTNCRFYVFLGKDNKPMYANKMTENGAQYYIKRSQQARQSIK